MITPLCGSMSLYMTYIDENGVTRFEDKVRTTGDFHHPKTGPVPENQRLKALSIQVIPHPRH